MLSYIKNFLASESENPSKTPIETPAERLQVATCALFVEIAAADDDFTEVERKEILNFMTAFFKLDEVYAKELISIAEEAIKNSVSVYEFTDLINNVFSQEEKFEILKNLWRLIFADNHLNKYEDFLVKKIGGNLKFDHQDIIRAKVIIKSEIDLKK